MALNKDILGAAIYNARASFCNKDYDTLLADYGNNEEAMRLAICKAEAEAIINHFTANAVLTVPGTGLAAPNGAVTGSSTTGTIS
jgi:hypothetical protein